MAGRGIDQFPGAGKSPDDWKGKPVLKKNLKKSLKKNLRKYLTNQGEMVII